MRQTRKCLDEIVDLFQSRSTRNGSELIDRVVDLYFMTADQQSVKDEDAFGDVMTRMAFAGDALSRARLAERISRAASAPRELLRRLACDEITVARPVLQYSTCLCEGDLISIIGRVEEGHLIATAHREKLTVPVTDLLMKRGGGKVLATMAGNTGAQFSPEGLKKLTETAKNCSELQFAINLRHDLAPGPLARLKRLAEAGFWQEVAESFLMTEEQSVTQKPRGSKPLVTEERPQVPPPSEEPEKDIEESAPADRKYNQPDEIALIDAARAGEIEETLTHFSQITQLNETMLEHCLFEAHIPALMVLCKAHGLSPGAFTALLQLKESHTGEPTNDTAGLMRRYDGMTRETAQRIIRFSDKRRMLDEVEDAIAGEENGSRTLDHPDS